MHMDFINDFTSFQDLFIKIGYVINFFYHLFQ